MKPTFGRMGGLVMAVPLLTLAALVAGYPLWRALRWAVTGADGGVSLAAFARLAGDAAFGFALLNTLGFVVVYVGLLLPMGLGLALLLDRGLPAWLRSGCRLLLFSTHLVGPVYLSVLVLTLLARETGLLARWWPVGTDVLSVPWLAMPVVLAASLWASAGYAMVYFLAALQAVDPDLQDAARLDGAGAWRVLWHVTLPHVAPTAVFVATVAAVGGLQLFELPFVLFGGSAGPGNAALTVSMYLFSVAFERGDFAYASAIGWTLAAGVAGLTAVMLRRGVRVGGGGATL